MLTLIASFVENGTCEVVIGDKKRPRQKKETAVPQGAVIPSTLFNMVTAGLGYELEKISELRFAIYADDVFFLSKLV